MADENDEEENVEESDEEQSVDGDEETEEAESEGSADDQEATDAADGESDDQTDGESDDQTDDSEGSDEAEASESEESDDGDGGEDTPDLVDKMAESEQLEGVSKDAIKDALSEVAGDADGDDLADAVADLAGDDQTADDADEEETEVEVSDDEPDEGDADEEAAAAEEDEGEATADEDDEEPTAEEDDEESAPEPDDEPSPEPEPAPHAVGEVFTPEKNRTGGGGDSFLDDEQLEDYRTEESHTGVLIAGGAAAVVAAVTITVLFGFTKQGERLVHLFKGDLKEYELAQSKRQQAELREKQREIIDETPKIGTLKMRGKPQYGLIKVDGEIQYGKPEGANYWKRMRLTPKTSFPVFNVQDKHKVTIQSPGHATRKVDLRLGNWNPVTDSVPDLEDAALKYNNQIRVTLVPKTRARELEFHKRMQKDPENNFFGTVEITTKPKGAKVIFNGTPLKDEEGKVLKTPVTFEKYYYEPKDADELKEKKVKVDMPPDKGHKIKLKMPDGKGDYPKFVSGLQRQMWTCNWKDGEVPDNPHPKHCNYKFKLSLDFNKLKSSIEERDKQRQSIKEAWTEAQSKIDEIVETANRKAGAAPKKGKKGEKSGSSKSGSSGESSE